MKMNTRKQMVLGLLWLAGVAQTNFAEDVYFHLPVNSLTFTEGALPEGGEPIRFRRWNAVTALHPYAVLDTEGEVYLGGEGFNAWEPFNRQFQNQILAIRAPNQATVLGRLFVPKADGSGMMPLKFQIDAARSKADSRGEFLKAKESHYRRLLNRNIPGGAWFRHQVQDAAKARGGKSSDLGANPNRFGRSRPLDLDATYDLFSGGRAISENLQLDRVLMPAGAGESTVPLANLAGIAVREMDWKELIKEIKPNADPLAAFVPSDQHALFFPSFSSMTEMMDEADSDGTPSCNCWNPAPRMPTRAGVARSSSASNSMTSRVCSARKSSEAWL